jgi:RsiW-degrading membrane proteinase PrsW (M82 family)
LNHYQKHSLMAFSPGLLLFEQNLPEDNLLAVPQFLLLPLLSVIPCLLWLMYFYTRSLYRRESRRVIALTFLLGAAATLLAIPLCLLGQSLLLRLTRNLEHADFAISFLVIAPVEEFCKLLAVYLYAWRHQEFDEPLDGVIYSATAALGFAAAENVIYALQDGPLSLLLRGSLTNPGHALFSAFWGMSLSRAKVLPNRWQQRLPVIALGWMLASALHAFFNALLDATDHIGPIFLPVILLAMIALFLVVRSRINFHREQSPHRQGTIVLRLSAECPQCKRMGLAGTHCTRCGTLLPENLTPVSASSENNESAPADSLHDLPHFTTQAADGREKIAWILNYDEITVGRTLNNNFVIEHPSVSRRHARLTVTQKGYQLFDLESSNGTFVNGQRIREALLRDGSEVRFGSVSFIYRAPAQIF